jgi:hypothetical protein
MSSSSSSGLDSETTPIVVLIDDLYYETDGDEVSCFACEGFSRHFGRNSICFDGGIFSIQTFDCYAGEYGRATCIKSVWVPSSIVTLADHCFSGCAGLSFIAFESGSQVSQISESAFSNCPSLSSICIPSSVDVIGQFCFWFCSGLAAVSIDPHSKLSQIEYGSFLDCSSLSSISLPAGLSVIGDLALAGTRLVHVSIEPGNGYFEIYEDFVVELDSTSLVLYFGSDSEVEIPSWIESLHSGCLCDRALVSRVLFESGSRIVQIPKSAFSSCSSLSSICIPSSVEVLRTVCFHFCKNLARITFERGSQLSRIEARAFYCCSSLSSISIPSSVEVLCPFCFEFCSNLWQVRFESGSKLSRFDPLVFALCSSLSSMCIPSAIQGILRCYEGILHVISDEGDGFADLRDDDSGR